MPETSADPRPLRVLLVDDHSLFRTGLRELLERRGLDVVDAVGVGADGVSRADDLDPDLVLLDLRMPNDDGLATLKALRQQAPQVAVVMLTTSDDENDLVRTLRAGAQGYLLKDMEPDELVDCLKSVAGGTTIVAPVMTAARAKVVQGELLPDVPVRFSDLTERELEILHYLAEGFSNKAIARELGIVDGTVKLHVRAILKKLGIRSRVEAAILALEEGLSRRNI